MSAFYIMLVIILGCHVRGGVIQNVDNESDKFEEFLHKRCTQNADMFDMEEHAHKLKVTQLCLAVENVFTDISDDVNEIREQCETWTDEVDKCFDAILDLTEPCFKSQEKYIPTFARESYKAYLNYFCANPKIFTVTELLETNMAKCFNRFMKHPETDPQNTCFSTMKVFDDSFNSPITKRQMCRDLNTVYSCYERHYKQYCRDSPKAWEFQGGLINALRSPCNNGQ